jgi:hypothetical protein
MRVAGARATFLAREFARRTPVGIHSTIASAKSLRIFRV